MPQTCPKARASAKSRFVLTCPNAPRRGPEPRDRVGPGRSQTPATGMFGVGGRPRACRDPVRQADPNCRASAVDPSTLSAREPPRSCDDMRGVSATLRPRSKAALIRREPRTALAPPPWSWSSRWSLRPVGRAPRTTALPRPPPAGGRHHHWNGTSRRRPAFRVGSSTPRWRAICGSWRLTDPIAAG